MCVAQYSKPWVAKSNGLPASSLVVLVGFDTDAGREADRDRGAREDRRAFGPQLLGQRSTHVDRGDLDDRGVVRALDPAHVARRLRVADHAEVAGQVAAGDLDPRLAGVVVGGRLDRAQHRLGPLDALGQHLQDLGGQLTGEALIAERLDGALESVARGDEIVERRRIGLADESAGVARRVR